MLIELDICKLFEETINYIKKLEENMHQLKWKRYSLLESQPRKIENENIETKVAMDFYGNEAIISIINQGGSDICGGFWSLKIMVRKWRLHNFLKESFSCLYSSTSTWKTIFLSSRLLSNVDLNCITFGHSEIALLWCTRVMAWLLLITVISHLSSVMAIW